MPEDPDKSPLEYRNYADDRPQRRANVAAFITGFLPGVLGTAATGCFTFTLALHPSGSSANNFKLVPVYGCAAVIAGVLGVMVLRGEKRRFALAGLLLGIALTCIAEGICFFG